jgi:hypothetical protein
MVEVAQVVDINLVGVLVATVVYWITGAVWYSPLLFAKPWQRMVLASSHLKEKDMRENAATAMIGSFFCYLVMLYVAAYFFSLLEVSSAGEGAVTGAWIALGFQVPILLANSLYHGTRKKLFAINAGYSVVAAGLAGAVLAAFVG